MRGNGDGAPALDRDRWLDLARKLDWTFSYVSEEEIYPRVASGEPWLGHEAWEGWNEPYRTTLREYVGQQTSKEQSVEAVRELLGRGDSLDRLPREWLSGLLLHGAVLPLAEFAAVVGNLRAVRFGRDGAWRQMALLGALDELRHTQIPLRLNHALLKHDARFDWTHKFYHSNNWVAIAARHLMDELLRGANPIEFAIATNFVFETGFTNLQFVALAALAHETSDHLFEEMVTSIQTDEARHAQIGPAVLRIVVKHDREYAQYLADKWFWRSWRIFAVASGLSMDYLTPLEHRKQSFKEFMQEWIVDQYLSSLAEHGLEKPWYWQAFLDELDTYHHMVYASAYTYRSTVWFDLPMPGPADLQWLRLKYPRNWDGLQAVWERIHSRWRTCDDGVDFAVHGTSIISFCSLCQVVLCAGTPQANAATVLVEDGRKYVFCSEPCRWIFEQDRGRYATHKDLVQRVLAGQAPANLVAMLTSYMGLDFATWGKDSYGGSYPWLRKTPRQGTADRTPSTVFDVPGGARAGAPGDGAMMPLVAFLEGDTLGILLFAYEGDTPDMLAGRLFEASTTRVEPFDNPSVVHKGRVLRPDRTLPQQGVEPLDRVDVVRARAAIHKPV